VVFFKLFVKLLIFASIFFAGVFSGESDNGKRMEILEIPSHKFFFAVQFHPEFSSRPGFPESAFKAFLEAAAN